MYASNQTTNYDLSQWLPTDPVHHEDFNGDNAKLDAALADKADAADLEHLSSTVSSLSSTLAGCIFDIYDLQHETGNCQIETTTYTGTGYHGSSHANSLSFSDGTPVLVLVIGWDGSTTLHMVRGMTKAQPTGFYDTVTVSWTDSGVSWYGDDEEIQMNENAREYHVVTLLACD
mgnify:FL=1